MAIRKYINNISSLQILHLLRFTTFLIISMIFTKSHLTIQRIGDFEIMLFIASIVSFFWVTGIIQSFLSLYNNNHAFPGEKNNSDHKSPEIFNAFLVLSAFSALFFLMLFFLKSNVHVFNDISNIPYANLLLIYILISNPTHMIEYIYVVKHRSMHLLWYGIISYSLQLVIVAGPVIAGYDINMAFWGLIIISVLRLIMLGILLKKYAEFKISIPFIKAHLSLGYPLIVSTLLSGSAQYIDGLIVANKFGAGDFAIFRYGAKELPLVVMMANGLSNAMIPEFSTTEKTRMALHTIRTRSKRLIHTLFPISILIMLISNPLFIAAFNPHFRRSADVFMVYILLIISRLIFPQTILIGLKHTRIVMLASAIEIILNVSLSLYMIQFYGFVGVAVATAVIYVVEKMVLIAYNYYKLGIKPNEYIPVVLHLTYSSLLILLFVLIDHRIIKLY
ncbi:MAG TPA: polysaccharide biosynthesis C-terminal domain-containing protein [Bacteroidales bacterium]|nr:polysaccharide biosynthesis C-terminal domain-containing protein [Bacteroidales bacterium]